MTILDERGVFWWNDDEVQDNHLASGSHVAGRCKIEDDGRAFLELDGYLPGRHGLGAAMARGPVTNCIQGLLKESGNRILLSDLVRNGGRFSTNGISFERYAAMNALVGRARFGCGQQAPDFDTLEIPLRGFEEWLCLGTIIISNDDDGKIVATCLPPSDLTYPSDDDGILSIVFDVEIDNAGAFRTHAFSLKQTALLRLSLHDTFPLKDLRTKYGMIEDLLKILTGSEYRLDWPNLSWPDGSRCRWYFARSTSKGSAASPEYYNTITNFVELRDQFGSIWSRWNAGRNQYGPGFYLYLGTRRGLVLYEEHRFVSLVWGLEAFHRKKGVRSKPDALAEKIERILAQISCPKDRKWLERQLKTAHEPSLSQRLLAVFSELPTDLDEAKLTAFLDACARVRNTISHFGGQQLGEPYSNFIRDLQHKSMALSTLYHALILHEIGIDAALIKRWLYNSFDSDSIAENFTEVGLLKQHEAPPTDAM